MPTIVSPSQVRHRPFPLVIFGTVFLLVVERIEAGAFQDFACLLVGDGAGIEDRTVGPVAHSITYPQVALGTLAFAVGDGSGDRKFNGLSARICSTFRSSPSHA